MKRIFFAVIFALLPFAFANPGLQEISGLLAKNKMTRGTFTLEKKAASSSRALKSSGEFAIASDYGIIWKTTKPVKNVQVMAKEFSLSESPSGKRVKVGAAENPVYAQMALLTSALWTGRLEGAEQAAELRFYSDESGWRLELFPKDKSVQMALEKIVVGGTCSGGQAYVRQMEMLLAGGSAARYELSGHVFGGSLTASELSYFD